MREMLSIDDVKDLLNIPLVGVIPESDSVLSASNSGVPVIHDIDSRSGQAYADVVDRFMGVNLPLRFLSVEKKGLLSRIFGN